MTELERSALRNLQRTSVDPQLPIRLDHAHKQKAVLAALKQRAAELQAEHLWLRLASALRLEDDPGATFSLLDSADRACSLGQRETLLHPEIQALAALVAALRRHCAEQGWRQELENRMVGTDHLSGHLGDFPLLGSLTTPPHEDLADRVAALHFLTLAGILYGGPSSSAAVVVADAARKSRSISTWAFFVRELPNPPESPNWILAFVLWVDARLIAQRESRDPPAIVEAVRSLALLLTLLQRNQGQSKLPLIEEELEPAGVLFLDVPDRTAAPRDSSESRNDVDEHRQMPFAVLQVDGADVRGGQEPTQVPVHVRPALRESETPAAQAVCRQDATLCSFQLTVIEQSLRWCWDHLNHYELRLLAQAFTEQAAGGVLAEDAIFAATVLATGQPVLDVLKIPIATSAGDLGIDRSGQWTRQVSRPAQSWVPDVDTLPKLQEHSETLTLFLPAFLRSAYARLIDTQSGCKTVGDLLGICAAEAIARLSTWLQPLRDQHPAARLTVGRLWRALGVEVRAIVGNDAAAHFATATPRALAPISGYYTAVPLHRLQEAYQLACRRLFATQPKETGAQASVLGESVRHVGSQKIPTFEWIRLSVEGLIARVESSDPTDLASTHNSFTGYVAWLLMLATGHRPVKHPIESRDILDLEGGWITISDKLVRGPDEARIAPLCKLAIAALRNYVEHLNRLAALAHKEAPQLASRIRSAARKVGPRGLPLLFLLTPELRPQDISEAELTSLIPELSALEANFGRHLLSSGSVALGEDADLVREMLGQIQHGQPTFGPQSPMRLEDYAALTAWLEHHLCSLGWRAIESPFPKGKAQQSALGPAHHTLMLGREIRRNAVQAAEVRARDQVRSAIRAKLARKRLPSLRQADVDEIFRSILGSRKTPATRVELDACQRAYRFLSWCRRRYDLQFKLPAVQMQLPTLPHAFDHNTLEHAKLARGLALEFQRLLEARARDVQATPSGSRQLVEAVASLIINSRIADPQVAIDLYQSASFTLVNDGPDGVYVVFELPSKGDAAPMYKRFPLHPLTAALLDRLQRHRLLGTRPPHDQQRQALRLLNHLQAQMLPGATDFSTVLSGIRWLCNLISALNFLELPGTVGGYLCGSTNAVSLPPDTWARMVTGRALTARALPENEQGAAPHPAEPHFPTLLSVQDEAATGAALSRARSLFRAVNSVLRKHVRRLMDGDSPSGERLSRNQKELLIPSLGELVDRFGDAPVFARACVQWLIHLLEDPRLRAVSCVRYYRALVPNLPEALVDVDLHELNSDGLAMGYGMFIDLLSETAQDYAFHRLQSFHTYLMSHHGWPPVDWEEVVPIALLCKASVDAGLLTWAEYEAALDLLAHDSSADERTRVIQSVILLLGFRYGARVSEVLGLQRKDVIWDEGQLILLLRPNCYRELKTHAAVRQVPLIGPLSPLEKSLLESWLSHIDHCFPPDRLAALLASRDRVRHLVDTRQITGRITEALQAVTGDLRQRFHYGRHSFGCRLQLIMCLDTIEAAGTAATTVARVLGPIEPTAARQLLMDTPKRSRRGLWAAKLALGHASPVTTQRCYFHLDDLLSWVALQPVFHRDAVQMGRRTIAYVLGVPDVSLVATIRLQPQTLSLNQVVKLHPESWTHSASRVHAGTQVPALPIKAEWVPPPLTPVEADLALSLVYRRGQLDGAHQTLLLPAARLQSLFVKEYAARAEAGYDLPNSRWPATPSSLAVKHVRSGSRERAETTRVQPFLKLLQPLLEEPDFVAATRDVCRVWQQRYRHDCTPLVVGSEDELIQLVSWARDAGIEPDALAVRLPNDAEEPSLQRLGATPELRDVRFDTGPLPLARSRHRRRDDIRIGFLIVESDRHALTQMTQFHRVMHVLSALHG